MYSPSPNFFYNLVLNFVIAVGKMRRKLNGVFNLFLLVKYWWVDFIHGKYWLDNLLVILYVVTYYTDWTNNRNV